jgi:hypothetical protein
MKAVVLGFLLAGDKHGFPPVTGSGYFESFLGEVGFQ